MIGILITTLKLKFNFSNYDELYLSHAHGINLDSTLVSFLSIDNNNKNKHSGQPQNYKIQMLIDINIT